MEIYIQNLEQGSCIKLIESMTERNKYVIKVSGNHIGK